MHPARAKMVVSFRMAARLVLLCALGFPVCASTPVKVGVGRVFPISYRDASGKHSGFAIDVLTEAARREGITLEWRNTESSQSAEDDLRSGRIDLIPAGMVTPERERMFFVSAPWWSAEMTMVVRSDHPKLTRLGMSPIFTQFARKTYPSVSAAPFPGGVEQAISALCRGDVDAVLLTHGELHDLFLNRPEQCQGVPLVSGDTTIVAELAVIARHADRKLATRLRKRIDEMTLDGTLMAMAVKNPPISTSSVLESETRLRSRFNQRLYLVTGGALALLLLWFLRNRRREYIRAKKSESALRDLHEQLKKSNAALDQAHKRLVIKNEVARIGTFEWFVQENRVEWSPEMEKLYGVESATHEHTLEEWKSLVHPDDLKPTLTAIEDALRNSRPSLDTTYRIIRPDGAVAWIHSRGSYEYDAAGKPLYLLGVNMDVTDLKRSEQNVERASRMMELALEAAESGAWIWDATTGELTWSDSYFRVLRVDPAVKPSLDLFYSLVHPDDLRRVKANVEDSLQGRIKEFRMEFRIRTAAGIRWVQRHGRVYFDSGGNVRQVVGITTDITERRILRGFLPTCARCKKIRDEHNHWENIETYISEHSDARFSHGLCPDCYDRAVQEEGLAAN